MSGDPTPFDFAGDRRGVLCIHGFTSTPFVMRYLGERIAESGFTTVGPLLPGHNTTPEDLARTTWHDWYAEAERAFDDLARRCDRVAVVGQSMGGLLALHLAQNRGKQVAAVGSFAVPMWLGPITSLAVKITQRWPDLIEYFPKLSGVDIKDPAMKSQIPSYSVLPTRSVHSLVEFIGVVRTRLSEIEQPLLLMHSINDHTAPVGSANAIAKAVRSKTIVQKTFTQSYHILSLDCERERIAADTVTFLTQELGT